MEFTVVCNDILCASEMCLQYYKRSLGIAPLKGNRRRGGDKCIIPSGYVHIMEQILNYLKDLQIMSKHLILSVIE